MNIKDYSGVLTVAQVDGAALTAAARASCIPAANIFTIPPNYFDYPGKQLKIKATGRISSLITTPGTARFDVNFLDSAAVNAIVFDGLAVLLDTVAAHVNEHWDLEIDLELRGQPGIAATLFGTGRWSSQNILGVPAGTPRGGLTALLPWGTAPVVGAPFNSTLEQKVDLRFTQTVATGSLTVHKYALISPN